MVKTTVNTPSQKHITKIGQDQGKKKQHSDSLTPLNITVYCFRKFVLCLASEAITHLTVDDATMTYETARHKCIGQGLDLCSYSEICPHETDGIPSITGTLLGDKWAPIRWMVKM